CALLLSLRRSLRDLHSFPTRRSSDLIPVIGDVAAGLPITVDLQFDEMISLPTDWIINQKESFALRVTGDSMIGAGIDKGDIAIEIGRSTRLNSSHVSISYAVFCLKQK